MTKENAIRKQFIKALFRLKEVLTLKKDAIIRDAAIQRFEFTFDLSWKLLKVILEENKGILVSSPKDTFRQAYKAALIQYDELWLEMTDMRNITSHTYNETIADKIYKKLPNYLKAFEELEKSLEKEETL